MFLKAVKQNISAWWPWEWTPILLVTHIIKTFHIYRMKGCNIKTPDCLKNAALDYNQIENYDMHCREFAQISLLFTSTADPHRRQEQHVFTPTPQTFAHLIRTATFNCDPVAGVCRYDVQMCRCTFGVLPVVSAAFPRKIDMIQRWLNQNSTGFSYSTRTPLPHNYCKLAS